ncbi:MAG: hypothetical protein FWH47_05325 [Methanomassiliicoccaceae archaeon]|nr:hypothetical protein [Methanomassiliicoccaceae archaeon]
MWIPSPELQRALIHGYRVIEDPKGHPAEFVEALREIADDDSFIEHEMRYRFDGYILMRRGVVGIRPDSKPEVREEWMRHWQRLKDNPLILI